jgi:hypothetical protein
VRVLSGVQCTGVPHLGNYLGALQQWVELQSLPSAEIYYSAMGKTSQRALFRLFLFVFSAIPLQLDSIESWTWMGDTLLR